MIAKRCILLLPLVLLLAGCGGGTATTASRPATGGDAPPVDLAYVPAGEPLRFGVAMTDETEVMGNNFQTSIRYEWTADDWQAEADGTWTARVTFAKIKATRRSEIDVTMRPIEHFDRLEGFHWRFRLDDDGFEPDGELGKDRQFKAVFGTLAGGVTPLSLRGPGHPVAPGEAWTDTLGMEDNPFGPAMKNNVVGIVFARDEKKDGRDCARFDMDFDTELDGILGEGSDQAQKAVGKVELRAKAWFARALGHVTKTEERLKTVLDLTPVDAHGEPTGQKQVFTTVHNVTVTFFGN
ncbi:MAG: hypothetical protein JW819_10040 [Candidatus Krumholzibacteriota bacterium]|nr:hypothetical protein [Candidatus Krumholzibacteriota bacterium]